MIKNLVMSALEILVISGCHAVRGDRLGRKGILIWNKAG